MEVTALDSIEIKDPDMTCAAMGWSAEPPTPRRTLTDARSDEVLQRGTAEPAGADDGDACGL